MSQRQPRDSGFAMPVPSSGAPDGVTRSRPQPTPHWRRHPKPSIGVDKGEADPKQCSAHLWGVHITDQVKGAPGALQDTVYVAKQAPAPLGARQGKSIIPDRSVSCSALETFVQHFPHFSCKILHETPQINVELLLLK